MEQIREIAREHADDFIYLNAMRSPKKRIQNKFRMQILMRLRPNSDDVRKAVYCAADSTAAKFPQVSIFTEINPNDLN